MKIEKGIPVPKRHRATSESGKLIEEMEQGSSVLFAEEKKADSLRVAGTNRGYRMSIYRRTQAEDGETGWRVWLMDKNWKPKKGKKPARAAAPVIPLLPPRPVEPIEPDDLPPMDEARVTELHGLCIAQGCRATILHARQWVAEGVTADRLRSALSRKPTTATALSAILREGVAA